MDFIVTSWRDGATSALEMGLLHGAYCLGCCWLLFVILFPLGIMNLGAMAAVTLLIFAEKTLPWPRVAQPDAGSHTKWRNLQSSLTSTPLRSQRGRRSLRAELPKFLSPAMARRSLPST
jgi:hypothetical protein